MSRLIVFTGGGTAGHVYPGLAVIEKLQEEDPGIEVIWMGSSGGMEKALVEEAGVRFIGVPSGKLRRYFSLKNISDLFRITAGFFKSVSILKKLKPGLIFSKGGFVSVPPVIAGGFLKIPVISHESDVTPGLATRINSRFSEKILTAYPVTAKYLSGLNTETAGNPVRSSIRKADAVKGRSWAQAGERPIILILGGSQGALQINLLIQEIAGRLAEKYTVVHQMGSLTYKASETENYITKEFIKDELPDIIAAADLVISRAGASALWEFSALSKPMILIPLGTAGSRGDQILNAEIFSEAGAAEVLSGEVQAGELLKLIENIMSNDSRRNVMSEKSGAMSAGDPAVLIAKKILERIE